MAKQIKDRKNILKAALWDRWWTRAILLVVGVLGIYDTIVGHALPKDVSDEAPNLYEVVLMLSPLLPWWTWALIIMALVTIFSVEYSVRQSNETPQTAPPKKKATPDVWVLDAVHYLATGEWGKSIPTRTLLVTLGKVTTIFRQHAFDGDVTIWGRETRLGVLRKIPKEYWKWYGINLKSLLDGNPEEVKVEIKEHVNVSEGPDHFLKTNKKQVEAAVRGIKKPSYKTGEKKDTKKLLLSFEEPAEGYNQPIINIVKGAGSRNPMRANQNRCRIKIKNISSTALERVTVKLEKIISLKDGRTVSHAGIGLPLRLKQEDRYDMLNEPYTQYHYLKPDEYEEIEVLSHYKTENNLPNKDYIMGWALRGHATPTIRRELQAGDYELVIIAYNDKGPSIEQRFIVELKDGLAEMRLKES